MDVQIGLLLDTQRLSGLDEIEEESMPVRFYARRRDELTSFAGRLVGVTHLIAFVVHPPSSPASKH